MKIDCMNWRKTAEDKNVTMSQKKKYVSCMIRPSRKENLILGGNRDVSNENNKK